MAFPIGPIIAGLRKTKGIRQSELAERAGLKQPSLSRIENGQVAPRQATLERICSALNYTIHDLYSERILEYINQDHRPELPTARGVPAPEVVKLIFVNLEGDEQSAFDADG